MILLPFTLHLAIMLATSMGSITFTFYYVYFDCPESKSFISCTDVKQLNEILCLFVKFRRNNSKWQIHRHGKDLLDRIILLLLSDLERMFKYLNDSTTETVRGQPRKLV